MNNFSAPSVKAFEIWLMLSIRNVTVQYLRSDFVQWNISFKDSKGKWLKENEPSGDELGDCDIYVKFGMCDSYNWIKGEENCEINISIFKVLNIATWNWWAPLKLLLSQTQLIFQPIDTIPIAWLKIFPC